MLTSRQLIIIYSVMAILLLLCLLNMPYGYYQLIRFIALIIFGILAYHFRLKKDDLRFFIYLALAILFQPLIKITLGRDLWNIIDIIVALWLIVQSIVLESHYLKKG